ncbi:MAG: GDSL-type esterase/lipase family protein [Bacteroidota bacterium]
MKKILLSLSALLILAFQLISAQTLPYEQEVKSLSAKIDSVGWSAGGIVFTGSSTIRMWKDLSADFPEHPLINTGFGGSQAKDLQRFLYPLVLRFEPSRVFIYEGDNDIWADVSAQEIIHTFEDILSRIHLANPQTEIYLIGAKPSPSRWEKAGNYQEFNKQLEDLSNRKEKVTFVDTWAALTDADGRPRPQLYLNDQLHLNDEGYLIWKGIFRPYFD